jgi:hypothetical protein
VLDWRSSICLFRTPKTREEKEDKEDKRRKVTSQIQYQILAEATHGRGA